ncbi:MAG: nucleotidyltransferase family protein [Pseudomonadota bacterium]
MNCELVLLAAGQAKRFGSDKRFAELPNGKALWRTSMQIYVDAGLSGHLVVGENESSKFHKLPEGIQVHECTQAVDGMSRSLAFGLKQVKADFALVALADMPFLRVATVLRLLDAANKRGGVRAIQASYMNKPGHPKVLSRYLFRDLCSLKGDQGGIAVLKKLPGNQLKSLELNDPGILSDVDVPSDLFLATN